MRNPLPRLALLAGGISVALAFGALAQADSNEQKRKELEVARAELDRAARKVAELSRELGGHGSAPFAFEHRIARRPVLGVVLEPDDKAGTRIAAVTPESGAAKAGLRAGDRIVSVDGKPVTGADGDARLRSTRQLLGELKADTPVTIGYERDGKRATAKATPSLREPLMVMSRELARRAAHDRAAQAHRFESGRLAPLVTPAVRAEILRMSPDARCKDGNKDGETCRIRVLSEAFRWSGLNLASVDKELGRYFGTDSGVLVLSAGRELGDLRAGDVIRRIDGKPVDSPREAMDALRGKPEGATVAVEYLRDRKTGTAQLKVPKAMRIPLPPAPPAPPSPPAPPAPPTPAAPDAPPAPPAPPPPPGVDLAMEPFDVIVDVEGVADTETLAFTYVVDQDVVMPAPVPVPRLDRID